MSGLLPLLSAQQAHEWLMQKEAILIDMRSLTAFKALHIPHSLHAAHADAIVDLVTAQPTERVILLCAHQGQATDIMSHLHKKSAPALESILFYVLDGGLNGWRNAQLPVARDGGLVMSIERQIYTLVGVLLCMAALFSWLFSSVWLLLILALGGAFIASGLTGWYGLHQLILHLPWNRHDET